MQYQYSRDYAGQKALSRDPIADFYSLPGQDGLLTQKAAFPIMRSLSAGIAQLVERNLAKVEVASSNLVSRSIHGENLTV